MRYPASGQLNLFLRNVNIKVVLLQYDTGEYEINSYRGVQLA